MSKRAVIFDFGGVLMKTLDRSPRYAWDDRLGLPHGSVERVVHGSDYWASVARALKIDDADVQQLAVDYFSADYLDKTLVELIEKLHVRGHAVALLSNDSPALLDKLHTLGIARLFDPLIVSANIGVMKPDAQAYQAVLNALQLAPGEAIFVDDMPANVVGAQALGIHAVRYVDGMDLASALEPLLEN
jgi:epoxide hydrolase-like predicted phosphatase